VSRTLPQMVGFRVTERERAALDALARYDGTTIAALLRTRIVPWVQQELARRLLDPGQDSTET
jgi:hypothetical protein